MSSILPPKPDNPFIGVRARVTKDRIGRIANTPAARILRRLGADEKDNEMLLAIIEAAPNPTAGVLRLISLLKMPENRRKKITNVAFDAKVPVFEIFEAYSKGIQRLGHEEALATVSESMLEVLHSLIKQATPKEIPCTECNGERLDAKRQFCKVCGGDGILEELPRFWMFAQKQIWKITGLDSANSKTGGGLTINQNLGTVTNQTALLPPTPGMMEKIATYSDEILHNHRNLERKVEVLAESPIEAVLTTTIAPILEPSTPVFAENSPRESSALGAEDSPIAGQPEVPVQEI